MFQPAGSTWIQVFYEEKPRDSDVLATLELTDGRRLAGVVRSFTAEMEDNRELALLQPHASPNRTDPLEPTGGSFMVIRESQIATITGRYVERAAEPAEPAEPAEDS